MRPRRNRPLFVIDIALPRDVEAAAGEIEQVFLYNIDDLQATVRENLARRASEVARAEAIVDEEVEKFAAWFRSRGAIPTVVALRQRFETIRRAELERLDFKLSALPPEARTRVDEITHLIVEKLLLTPTEQLKALGDAETVGAYAEALTRLFGLAEQAERDDAPRRRRRASSRSRARRTAARADAGPRPDRGGLRAGPGRAFSPQPPRAGGRRRVLARRSTPTSPSRIARSRPRCRRASVEAGRGRPRRRAAPRGGLLRDAADPAAARRSRRSGARPSASSRPGSLRCSRACTTSSSGRSRGSTSCSRRSSASGTCSACTACGRSSCRPATRRTRDGRRSRRIAIRSVPIPPCSRRRLPSIVTAWIPLTDVTPLDSCIYVVPAACDPDYYSEERGVRPERIRLQDVRALPAAAGSVVGWSTHLAHWGSRSSRFAAGPRIAVDRVSAARATCRRAIRSPSTSGRALPFGTRLAWIAESLHEPECSAAWRADRRVPMPDRPTPELRLGSRGSQLALWQANTVARRIAEAGGPPCRIVVIRTSAIGCRRRRSRRSAASGCS